MWMLRSQCNSAQMNNWQPQNPRSRFGAIYLKNSTANPVHLPQKWAKWAELAALVTPKPHPEFNFFNCHGCQTCILGEISCYRSPTFFGHINSFLSAVTDLKILEE